MMSQVPAPSRCRAYAAALRAAYALAGFGPAGVLRSVDVDPEIVERYRLLLVAAAVARGGSDGAAVAAVLGRGYVLAPGATTGGKLPAVLYPVTTPSVVWLGVGLPRYGSPWWAIARCARKIDVTALPQVKFVSAHVSLKIRGELRSEGHDLG
ncbi:hypothetical protein [uncultured Amaricoccus sp.]|uniref:hypothetical protein n=1 Tax=uncultured Amaricoccus sp. TaxID=339341 RepID=UPI002601D22B|nr:hypothetical protein [uncultured Amaricoccus sp.]